MTPAIKTMVAVVTLAVLSSASTLHAPPVSQPAAATQPVLDQAALEKQFEQTMSGAVLVGRSTNSARPDAPSKEERYTMQRVSKVAGGDGDRWLFISRMQFGGKDVL